MLSKKILLSSALISMAGLVACGDDSSSNAGDDSNNIPEKVETIEKALRLNCTEEIKCTMVYVEEVKDNFFCNGTKFEPYSPILNAKDCPAEEENKGEEGTEEGSEEGGNGSDDNGNKSEGSEGSENTGDNGGSTEADSSDSSAESSADTGDNSGNSASSEEVTGPTGDVVSCLQEMTMEFGGETISTQSCSEIAASSENAAAMQTACQSVEGFLTATLGTGCPTPYTKKCVIDNENVAYFYEAANANESCEDLVKKN